MLPLMLSHAVAQPPSLQPGVAWTVPNRERWSGEWPTALPRDSGLDPKKLQALVDYSFRRDGDEKDRLGQRTNALVIVRHGKLVYEGYARGTTPQTPLLTWSVSKSFGSTVVGAAVHQGLLGLGDPACKHYPAMCSGGREEVRVTDLLRMSSGLRWEETYESSPVFSDVMGMLYTRGSGDMAAFVASHPVVHPPGAHWSYSSGDSNLLSAVLKSALGDRYDDFPWTAVIEPLGMNSAVYEHDRAGTYVASSYLYASARDLARMGQLWLDDGVWQGERVLAEGWVRYSTTMAPAFYSTPVGYEHVRANPGAQWYINIGDPKRGLDPPWPALPADSFGASGHWGKAIWWRPAHEARTHRCGRVVWAGESRAVRVGRAELGRSQHLPGNGQRLRGQGVLLVPLRVATG